MNNWHEFTAIYTRHRGFLISFFRSKRLNHEDAEDLTQQSFLLAARSWSDEMVQDPKPWMRKVAENVWRNHVRNIKAIKRDMPLVTLTDRPEAVSAKAAPPSQLQTKEWIQRMLACIEKLPEILRQVLCLRGPGNCSVGEVASLLNIEEGTVKSRTHSARKLLKACLDSTAQLDPQGASMEPWENYLNEALTAHAQEKAPIEGQHLDELSLVSFMLDEMAAETRELALSHLLYCPKCLKFLRALQAIDQAPPQPKLSSQPRLHGPHFAMLGLAAGLLLGIFGAFLFHDQAIALQNPIRVELDDTTKRGRFVVKIPADKDALDIQVHLRAAPSYPRYRLELHCKNQLFQTFDKVMPESGTISVILNPHELPPGLAVVRVYGLGDGREHLLAEHQFELSDLP